MHLCQMIDPDVLRFDRDLGFIRRQEHPTLPLDLYNYTEKAQFARHWTEATLACRGLIVDRETGLVIARPFPKFFNYGEQGAAEFDLDELVSVTDKVDGSLGILYPTGPSHWAIATRGSFTSDQADHATLLWDAKYAEEFGYRMNPRLTYLFEIVYPENRIVVDYRGLDDLVLIGAVDIKTGTLWGPEIAPGWPGPRAEVFPYRTLREAVHSRPRDGKEGFVVRSVDQQRMVKVKYDEYVSLHRVVTGLNEKEIWRRAMKIDLEEEAGIDKLDLLLRDIPDEMHEWVMSVLNRLLDEVNTRSQRIYALYLMSQHECKPSDWRSERGRRKALALWLNNELGAEGAPYQKGDLAWLRSGVFQAYDGHDPRHMLWRLAEPKGDSRGR